MLHATRCTYLNVAEECTFQWAVQQCEIKYRFLSWPTALYRSCTGIICIQLSISKQSDYRRSHPLRKLSGVFEPVPLVERDYTHNGLFRNTPCQHCRSARRPILHRSTTKSVFIRNLKLPFPLTTRPNRKKQILHRWCSWRCLRAG